MRRGVAVLALLVVACAPDPGPAAPRARNLLLVTVDTLRPDRLGTYGYARPTSPMLDRFAETAVVFDAAYASSSWTLPGVASIMTGLYTSTHGCWNGRSSLAPSYATLAEHLEQAGFATAAIVSHVFLDPRYGLDQGFADYDVELVGATKDASHLAITSAQITDKARARLAEFAAHPDQRWFLWAHYFDPHEVYQAHTGLSEAFGDEASDLYDGEIAFTDGHLGALFAQLDELGLAEQTLVIVTADHGEEFEEHGSTGHRQTLYEEVVRVPLIVRAPGCTPGRVAEVTSLVDITPTALELLGLPAAELSAGRSLAGALDGAPLDPGFALSELGANVVMWEAVTSGRWKLVLDRIEERALLFDLELDPGEQHDLAGEQPERVERLRAALRSEVTRAVEWAERFERSGEVPLSPRDLERLRELGYVED